MNVWRVQQAHTFEVGWLVPACVAATAVDGDIMAVFDESGGKLFRKRFESPVMRGYSSRPDDGDPKAGHSSKYPSADKCCAISLVSVTCRPPSPESVGTSACNAAARPALSSAAFSVRSLGLRRKTRS